MDKQLEYFDVLANTQKQLLGTIVNAQNDLRVQSLDSMSKVHSAVNSLPGLGESTQTKEAMNQFNAWFNTLISNSKTFSDEVMKVQENWNSAFDKQLEIGREVVKNFSELAKTATAAVKTKSA